MALKPVVTDISQVPEVFRSEYEQRDGKWFLKLDGDPPGYVLAATAEENARKLAEFRDNNRALNTLKAELETRLKSFDGIDPASHQALKERIAELEGKQKGMKGDDDVKRLLDAAVTPLMQRLDALTASDQEKARKLDEKELETELTQAGIKAGVDDLALPDFIRRGKETFRREEGKTVGKRGDTPLFSRSRPAEPLGVEEWVADLPKEAPHLFKPSGGGGARPGAGPPQANGAVRVIPPDARLSASDVSDIASGKAVRGEAVA
jgi:hypothetical protein